LDAELKDTKSQLEELEMKVTQLSPLTDEINQLRLKAQKLEYADRDLQDELKQKDDRLKEMETDKSKQQTEHQRVINELKQLQRATMERTQHHYQDLLEKQNKKVNELLADLERVSDDRKDRDRQIDVSNKVG
jgi:DNA repair exonuclease SbcCD ATPase subunit